MYTARCKNLAKRIPTNLIESALVGKDSDMSIKACGPCESKSALSKTQDFIQGCLT